jgi:hypothetical protein
MEKNKHPCGTSAAVCWEGLVRPDRGRAGASGSGFFSRRWSSRRRPTTLGGIITSEVPRQATGMARARGGCRAQSS